MAYPKNPPIMPFIRRADMRRTDAQATLVAPGVWASALVSGFFFWEPDRATPADRDWLVGPYRSSASAAEDRARFIAELGDGPEVRVWAVGDDGDDDDYADEQAG